MPNEPVKKYNFINYCQSILYDIHWLNVDRFTFWVISRLVTVIAGRFSAENFQKSSTALNRQWPLNFTDTPTKTNSKSFTISLIEIGLQMSPSLGPVSRHLLNSILDIEFTRLTVVVLVPLGLDLDYFLPKLLFPILISSYTAVI
jgi:hypothetical protein